MKTFKIIIKSVIVLSFIGVALSGSLWIAGIASILSGWFFLVEDRI